MPIIPIRLFAVVVTLAASTALQAQAVALDRLPFSRADEIRLARSAAPPDVSRDATVYVLERGGFVLAEQGITGVVCMVNRSRPGSLEPHCYDAEAARTIVPIRIREMELREKGWPKDSVDADIADGLRTGRFQPPARPAMSYMMSAAQQLINDAGNPAGAWQPHLMIYVPYVTPGMLGLSGAPSVRAAMVSDAGTALASILVVVREFVDPGEFTEQP